MNRYVVVADASRARILVRRGTGPLQEVEDIRHPEGRLHPGDLEEGGKGEQHESTSTTVRRTDPRTTVGEKQAARFARTVAERLQELRTSDPVDGLVIAAAPTFLGQLRASLDGDTERLVERTVDKDYTQDPAEKVGRKLGM